MVSTSDLRRFEGASFFDSNPVPPTIDEVVALFEDGKEYFKAFHDQCSTEDDYFFLNRNVPVPKNDSNQNLIDPVRPATATAIINVATDHVDVNHASIDIPIMLRSRARAERLKKFYTGVWDNIKTPVKRTATKQAFLYGISWLKPVILWHHWPNPPDPAMFGETNEDGEVTIRDEAGYKAAIDEVMEKRRYLFPFGLENVNPQNMVWDDSQDGPNWVIQWDEAQVGQIRRMFPQWTGGDKSPQDKTTFAQYWDGTWFGYFDGKSWIQEPKMHGYGFVPYKRVVPANSIDWKAGRPEKRYRGILKPVHSLLDAEARIMTQIEAVIRQVAYRGLMFGGGSEPERERVIDEFELYGGKNNIRNVSVAPIPMVQVPPDLFNHLNTIQTAIEEATFPNVVRGLRPKGVSAGFAIGVLSGQARLVFQGVADGMARAMEEINSGWAMFVENALQQPITVHGRSEIHQFDQTISPEDIKGYYENSVTLKAEAPEERERQAILAERMWAGGNGLISRYEAMSRAGVVNPLEEMNQIAAEQTLTALRDLQVEQLRERLAGNLLGQQQQAARGAPQAQNRGNQFSPGLQQLQRPGESNLQQARIASRNGQPSVFPQGIGGIDLLGRLMGQPSGGRVPTPSGERVGQ